MSPSMNWELVMKEEGILFFDTEVVTRKSSPFEKDSCVPRDHQVVARKPRIEVDSQPVTPETSICTFKKCR